MSSTVMTALLQCQQYTLIVVLQCTAMICQSINPDCFWKPIKLLELITLSMPKSLMADTNTWLTSYTPVGKSYVYWYKQV